MKNRQSENLHTIEQIKQAGNKIYTNKGEEGLKTTRGQTMTFWIEKEPNLYYPVSAKTLDY